jgi:hypothetical protein
MISVITMITPLETLELFQTLPDNDDLIDLCPPSFVSECTFVLDYQTILQAQIGMPICSNCVTVHLLTISSICLYPIYLSGATLLIQTNNGEYFSQTHCCNWLHSGTICL